MKRVLSLVVAVVLTFSGVECNVGLRYRTIRDATELHRSSNDETWANS